MNLRPISVPYPRTAFSTVAPSSTTQPSHPLTAFSTVAPSSTTQPSDPLTAFSTVAPSSTTQPSHPLTAFSTVAPCSTTQLSHPLTAFSTVAPSSTTQPPHPLTALSTVAPSSTIQPSHITSGMPSETTTAVPNSVHPSFSNSVSSTENFVSIVPTLVRSQPITSNTLRLSQTLEETPEFTTLTKSNSRSTKSGELLSQSSTKDTQTTAFSHSILPSASPVSTVPLASTVGPSVGIVGSVLFLFLIILLLALLLKKRYQQRNKRPRLATTGITNPAYSMTEGEITKLTAPGQLVSLSFP